MKTLIQILAIAVSSFLLLDCGANLNEKEKKIVGTWYCMESLEESNVEEGIPNMKITIEGNDIYCSDKTMIANGEVRVSVLMDLGYYKNRITYEYEIIGEGEWYVEGKYLVSKASRVIINFMDAKTLKQTEDDDVFIDLLKEGMDEMLSEMKKEMLKGSREKIVLLTDNELILRNDGKDTKYTRIE